MLHFLSLLLVQVAQVDTPSCVVKKGNLWRARCTLDLSRVLCNRNRGASRAVVTIVASRGKKEGRDATFQRYSGVTNTSVHPREPEMHRALGIEWISLPLLDHDKGRKTKVFSVDFYIIYLTKLKLTLWKFA